MANLILKEIGISRERVREITKNAHPDPDEPIERNDPDEPIERNSRITLTRGEWMTVQEVAKTSGKSIKGLISEIVKEAINK